MTKGITGFNIQRRRGTGSEQLSTEERQAKAELEAYFEDCATFVEARNKVISMAKDKEVDPARADGNQEEEDLDEDNSMATLQPPSNPDNLTSRSMGKSTHKQQHYCFVPRQVAMPVGLQDLHRTYGS